MSAQTGRSCKLYRNTGTWASPTWSEIDTIRDNTLNMGGTEVDASRRASAFKLFLKGLKEISVEGQIIHDMDDTNCEALYDAYHNDTNVEILVLDGAVTTAGSEGVRFEAKVMQYNRSEPLDDLNAADIVMKPAGDYTNAPTTYTATS